MGQITVARALARLLEKMGTEVAFGVNEYGEVKDIKLHGIADEPFMRKAIVALYAMPKFAYATKADVRIGSHCLFRIPAAMLTAPAGQ